MIVDASYISTDGISTISIRSHARKSEVLRRGRSTMYVNAHKHSAYPAIHV